MLNPLTDHAATKCLDDRVSEMVEDTNLVRQDWLARKDGVAVSRELAGIHGWASSPSVDVYDARSPGDPARKLGYGVELSDPLSTVRLRHKTLARLKQKQPGCRIYVLSAFLEE